MPPDSGIRAFAARLLFGDDIFISYSHVDGLGYAEQLEHALAKRGFTCAFDPTSSYANTRDNKLPLALRLQLLRSAMLVVVATREAARSDFVAQEVEEFIQSHATRGATLRAIAFGDSMKEARWKGLVQGFVLDGRTPEAKPDEDVLEKIQRSAQFTTRRRRLRRVALGTVGLLGLVIALGAEVAHIFEGKAMDAANRAKDSDTHAKEADNRAKKFDADAKAATIVAAAAKKVAELSDTHAAESDNKAREADGKAAEAKARAQEFERRAQDAARRADEARRAADDADRQRQHALEQRRALEMAASAHATLARDPNRALELARQAVERSQSSPEAVQSLREALAELTPMFAFAQDVKHSYTSCATRDGNTVFAIDRSANTLQVWDGNRRALRFPARPIEDAIWGLVCGRATALLARYQGPAYLLRASASTPLPLTDPGEPSSQLVQLTSDGALAGFGPEGEQFFTVTSGVYRVWSGRGDLLHKGKLIPSGGQVAMVSSDRLLVVGGEELSLIDVAHDKVLSRKAVATAPHYAGALIGAGAVLLTETQPSKSGGGYDSVFSAWRLPTFERVLEYADHRVVANRSGTLIAVGESQNFMTLDAVLVRRALVEPLEAMRSHYWRWAADKEMLPAFAFFPPPFDEQAFLTWDDYGSRLRVWDPTTGLCLKRVSVPGENLRNVFVADGGQRAFATLNNGFMASWELFPLGVPESSAVGLPEWDRVRDSAFSIESAVIAPNGRDVAYAVTNSQKITTMYLARASDKRPRRVWSARDERSLALRPMAFSPDGKLFASSDPTGAIHVDGETGPRCPEPKTRIQALAIANDGTIARAAYTAFNLGEDPHNRVEVMGRDCKPAAVPLDRDDRGPGNLAFTESGDILMIHLNRRAHLWNWRTNTMVGDSLPGSLAAINRDGSKVVIAETDRGPLAVWKAKPGGPWEKKTIEGFTAKLIQIALNEDGRFAVTRSGDDITRVWDLELGNLAWSIVGPREGQAQTLTAAAAMNGRNDVVTLWKQGTLRTDPCDVCRSAPDLVALAKDRARGAAAAPP